MGEKAEDAEAIVEADDDDTPGCQRAAVSGRIGGGAELKAAAVNPDHHGPLLVSLFRSGPDIEREAILTARPRPRIIFKRRKTPRAKRQRIAHAAPGRRRLRCAPAQRPDRWRGVGDGLERQHAADISALTKHLAGLRANLSAQFDGFRHQGMHSRISCWPRSIDFCARLIYLLSQSIAKNRQ